MAAVLESANSDDFLVQKSSVEFGDVIGRGGFSHVWYTNLKTSRGDVIQAAAKKVRNINVDEIQVMKGIKHPNVITFYGVLQDDGNTYIMMELAENGDLRCFLDRYDKKRLPIGVVVKWAFESACGIHYLHGIKHTHRDIKSLNYLIMKDCTIKLGDLGLAKVLESTQRTTGVRGTCRWMAPEVIKEQKRSVKSDVFSFGTVLWELFTTEIPYADKKGDFQVMNAICSGKRPEIPDDCPEELKQLIEVCWKEEYHMRPDMVQICQKLQEWVQREQSCEQAVQQLLLTEFRGPTQAGDDDMAMDTLSGSHAHTAALVRGAQGPLDTDGHGKAGGRAFNVAATGDVQMMSVSPYSSAQGAQSQGGECSDISTDTVAMYKMCNVPRGFCLIIDNVDFREARSNGHPQLSDREGSQADVEKLQYIFTKFKFTVRCKKNLKKMDMYNTLANTSREIPDAHDAFICCLLTHGRLGELAGTDGEYLEIQKILDLFTAEICPNLRGKPKMFFIQACQGIASQAKHGGKITTDAPGAQQSTGIGIALDQTLPNHADFLLGFATVPGHVSYRNTELGSWYISVLANKLDRLHEKEDLLSILTEVNGKLSKKSTEIRAGEFGQIPAPVTTLRKKVYFTLWEPCAQQN